MLVGAYYYAWYKDPWLHQTVRADDQPILREYRNSSYEDALLVQDHMAGVKSAAIDFVSVSWSPGQVCDHVLDGAREEGVKVTILYESLTRANRKKVLTAEEIPVVVSDMKAIAELVDNDAWLRIDGRPVIMLYVTRNYRAPEIFDAIRDAFDEDIFLVGDELFWKLSKPEKIQKFDAATAYNMYHPGKISGVTPEERAVSFLANARGMMIRNSEHCRAAGVPVWPVAMPGYDDTGVRPAENHLPLPRMNGKFFDQSLEDAMALVPPCVMITSFNEWYEDTQIEPASSYKGKYFQAIKRAKGIR
jgi:hypothetical protein